MESTPEQDKMDELIVEDDALSTRKTTYGIAIDSSRIRAVPVEEQSTALRDLAIDVFDHEEFEQGVLKQVDEAIAAKELESVVRAWEKELKSIDEEIRTTLVEIAHTDRLVKGIGSFSGNSYEARRQAEAVKRQRENKLKQLKKLEATQKSLYNKLGLKSKEELDECKEDTSSQDSVGNDPGTSSILQDRKQIMKQLNEEREKLIQTGQMTPFGGFVSVAGTSKVNEEESLQDNDYLDTEEDHFKTIVNQLHVSPERIDSDEYIPDEGELRDSWNETDGHKVTSKSLRKGKSLSNAQKQKKPLNVAYNEEDAVTAKSKHKKRNKDHFRHKHVDDGDNNSYVKRIRHERIKKLLKEQASQNADSDSEEEMPDMEFDNKMKIPGRIWHKLYQYQQTGVKWLWELHGQQAGGIIGDEMGLGKTIQAIAFLAGLKYSNIGTKKSRHGQGPILIVCPVTVLHQWVAEFHKWAPEFRVAVLHDTGSHHGSKDSLIKKICQANGVLVTSYSGVRINTESLLANHWDYVILDEGHKIRNPDAEITLACKQFRTPHRIILTGSPMQNNLRELWSLFDFVFPGKLGTLPVFMTEVSVPITSGGYANASDVQVQTAYKCACVLRDTINPYLLRRLKKDVKMCLDLPDKNEQVLFCRLTEEQRELYQEYLNSREVQLILAGNYKVFPGLIMLRKICNHPDLTSEAGSLVKAKQDKLKADQGLDESSDEDDGYGDWRRAGKMIVVEALLKMWKSQGHRVLLFSQSRQMLHILEQFVISRGYNYRRMDGSTSVASRQPLVNKFNKDSSIFVFLLTTRVGGIGVNLIGANRVIIYDPDWNPSTDIQARERSWRIGQTKNVTIYRLLTSGTIEEKIYHRQIFKQFLTNRVLKDPKQRRFFKTNDLYELFTLDESYKKEGTETSAIFAGTNCEIKMSRKKRRKTDPRANAQPVNTNKHVHKHTKKTKTEKTKTEKTFSTSQDDGGAFSIDARDISEITTTNKLTEKNPDDKKNDDDDDDKAQRDNMGDEQGTGAGELGLVVQQNTETAVRRDEPTPISTNTVSADTQPRPSFSSVSGVDTTRISTKKGNKNLVSTKTATSSSTTAAVGKRASTGDKNTSPRGKVKHTRKMKASLLSDKQLRRQLRLEKRKKRRRKKGKIEGQTIDNLDYHEVYSEGSSAADLEATGRRVKGSNEDTVLKTLFKAGGVHSALQHDVIMESGNPDYTLVETEANRVAQQAVQALKKSRQRCLRASAGVPTWTGLSGQSGLQNTARIKPRFGKRSSTTVSQDSPKLPKQSKDEPALFSGAASGMQASIDSESDQVSSNKLLEKMRARNNIVPDEETGTSAEAPSTEHDELLAEMSQFVASGGTVPGQATTRELVERFSTKLPKENSSLFRAMLRRICEFTRGDYQAGIWRLKNDFS